MNCTYCNKPVILTPSAEERAARSNQTAAYYESLFTSHSDCFIRARNEATLQLIRTIAQR